VSNDKPRRSIFGGLLFVLVGSILLAGSFYPEIRFWSFFARFWPAILILWGLAKLFDYFASQRSGNPQPPAFTAGEFFLLFFLIVLGVGVAGVRDWFNRGDVGPFQGDWPPGLFSHYTYREETSLKVAKPDVLINIQNARGDVNVVPWDTSEIRVVTQKDVLVFGNEADGRERAAQVRIEIREVTGGYEIRRVDTGIAGNRGRVSLDLEIHIPRQAAIEAKVQRGNLTLGGFAGNVTVDGQRSEVEVRDIQKDVDIRLDRGSIRISKVKGNVRLTGSGSELEIGDVGGEAALTAVEFTGPIRLTNIAKGGRFQSQRSDLSFGPLPGRLELDSGDLQIVDSAGSVDITTREKDIRLENIAGRVRIQNRRGNIELRYKTPPKDELDVVNESGNIEVTLPSAATFEISASSDKGEVESEFEGPGLKKSDEKESARLEGKVGTKGPQIRVKTTYGTVSLRKTT